MAWMTFGKYLALREGVFLRDRPAARGLPRINPTPFTLDRLKKTIPRPLRPSAPGIRGMSR